MPRVLLLVGTPKGAFILESDAERRDWSMRGPLCEGWPIHDLIVEPDSGALLAGARRAADGPVAPVGIGFEDERALGRADENEAAAGHRVLRDRGLSGVPFSLRRVRVARFTGDDRNQT